MSSINLKPRQQRAALGVLSQDRLKELLDHFELEVEDRRRRDECVNALVRSRKLSFEAVLGQLKRDELKEMCVALDLDESGRKLETLVQRILSMGSSTSSDGGGEFELTSPEPKPKRSKSRKAGKRTAQRKGRKPEEADVLSYRHSDRRKNNPHVGLVTPKTDPDEGKSEWSFDPHLDPELRFDMGRASVEGIIDDALSSDDQEAMRHALEQLRRLGEPYLTWTGKAERTSFEVDTVSLHVHERIDPMSILSAVRKRQKEKGKKVATWKQPGLFDAPFENLPLRDAIDFYGHDRGWSNRLVAGDSLLVMNSLLEKESMAGQVQMIYIDPPYGIKYGSNFQPFVGKRDVTDRRDEDLTCEPEMLKAFRDTWELGIHSYLAYLRDRLLLGRDLLSDSGSIFVQISDENVHRVRSLMDEVFGVESFVAEILVKKKGSQKGTLLDPVNDYVLWYGKSSRRSGKIRFNAIYEKRAVDSDTLDEFCNVELPSGEGFNLKRGRTPAGEKFDYRLAPDRLFADYPDARVYRPWPITNGGHRPNQMDALNVDGVSFTPPNGRCWSFRSKKSEGDDLSPMESLGIAGRLVAGKTALDGKRYLDDFPYKTISNWWDGLGGASRPVYVVQTNERIVERCLLMTTEPGDLVLDPTCGSGTTAVVGERWGRRWITCDTSRVAIALARQRLMTSSFDYYQLRHPHEGVKGGLKYKSVPRIALQAIANNPEVAAIYSRGTEELSSSLKALNDVLAKSNVEPLVVQQGARRGETIDPGKLALAMWELPPVAPDSWPTDAVKQLERIGELRTALKSEIDESVASNAEHILMCDDPVKDKGRLRICGPFTVEAVPSPTVLSLTDAAKSSSADSTIARSGESSRQHQWRDELFRTGIRGKSGQFLRFSELDTLSGTTHLHVTGSLAESNDRVVVSFGPEHAALEQRQVALALNEAEKLRPSPTFVVFCAFSFDPEAAKDIDETQWPGVTLLKAQMNADLLTEDLKKKRSSNESFWLMGQPDVELSKRNDGQYEVEVNGFDYFDTVKGDLISGGKNKIAVWMLDTDYDERSLMPHQVFFPMAGKTKGWSRLSKDIRGALDEKRLGRFEGTKSLPFEAGDNRRVAVKLVDDRGIESLKIIPIEGV